MMRKRTISRNPHALIVSAALFLFVAIGTITGQSISPEATQHWNAARQAETQKNFAQAVVEYRKVTELEPTFALGFINLGQALMENHDFSGAIAPLKHALELDANLTPAHQLLGYAQLSQGYAAEAIPHLERAHEQGALGIAQVETGAFAEAIANLQAALQKRPDDPDLLPGPADVAAPDIDGLQLCRAIKRSTRMATTKVVVTTSVLDSGQVPDDVLARHAADGYLEKPLDVRRLHRIIRDLAPDSGGNDHELVLAEALAHYHDGDMEGAVARLRGALVTDPGSPKLHFMLANMLQRASRWAEAVDEQSEVALLRPDVPPLLMTSRKRRGVIEALRR